MVMLDLSPIFRLEFTKEEKIKQIKNVITNYFKQNNLNKYDYTIRVFINNNTELLTFNTEKYDNNTLESVWKNIKDPKVIISSYRNKFTGNKDVDILILKSLDDVSITRLCKTNKYLSQLCQKLYKDEIYWEEKMRNVVHPSLIQKPKDKTWHQYYSSYFTYSDNQWKTLIKKVLTQVHPDTSITKEGLDYLLQLIKPIWNKIKKTPNNEIDEELKDMLSFTPIYPNLYNHADAEFKKVSSAFLYKPYDRKRIPEYLIAEILELSGNTARDARRHRINSDFIKKSIQKDEELSLLFPKL